MTSNSVHGMPIPDTWHSETKPLTVEEAKDLQFQFFNCALESKIASFGKDKVKMVDSDDETWITVTFTSTEKVSAIIHAEVTHHQMERDSFTIHFKTKVKDV